MSDSTGRGDDDGSNTTWAAARLYASKGLATFPLKKNAKVPATRNGLKDATTDASQHAAWWGDGNPRGFGIGIVPAPGCFVVDIDQPGGFDTWQTLTSEHGDTAATWSAKTPNGGRHLWFTGLPVDARYAKTFGRNVDNRTSRNYLAAWPSKVEKKDGSGLGEYTWDDIDAPIADADPWLIERAVKAEAAPEPPGPPCTADSPAAEGERHRYEPILKTALDKVRDSSEGRNNTVNEVLFDLYGFVKAEVFARDEIDNAVWDAVPQDRGEAYTPEEFNNTRASAWDATEAKRLPDGPATVAALDAHSEASEGHQDDEPTTWEPIDLRRYLRGEVTPIKPTIGLSRNDGLRLIYPGAENTVLGETESGKTWFALGCVAAEIEAGNNVLYIHYEEGNPSSTIERLQAIGSHDDLIAERLTFVAPGRCLQAPWLPPLLDNRPSLVVHDGVNEAMALHGVDILAADGAAAFRRILVTPCIRAGAATLSCDHVPKAGSKPGIAFGSVHKGNAIDGARIMLENIEPFGRGLRGSSSVSITKDRPGHLRAHGTAGDAPGKTFMGVLAVNATANPFSPDDNEFLTFYAPKTEKPEAIDNSAYGPDYVPPPTIHENMLKVFQEADGNKFESVNDVLAAMRVAGFGKKAVVLRETLDDLVAEKKVIRNRFPNKRLQFRLASADAPGDSQ